MNVSKAAIFTHFSKIAFFGLDPSLTQITKEDVFKVFLYSSRKKDVIFASKNITNPLLDFLYMFEIFSNIPLAPGLRLL